MKIVQINAVSNGSTGKIMFGIHNELLKQGHDSYVMWAIGRDPVCDNEYKIIDKFGMLYHKLYSHLLCKQGFASWHATKCLIKKLDDISPDIVHLHNLHSNYINIEILFNYLREHNIKVFWTFHDCWAFTGKCVHFERANCYKWKKKCEDCPILKDSPSAFIDKTSWCYNKKKDLLSNLNLTVVTPSQWLSNYVKESFLSSFPIYVINNGIDIDLFKPTISNFRKKYNIEDKKIILGVAGSWSERKGINDFIKLSSILDDSYIIFLVGVNKKQIESLPDNIVGISRTENQKELAEIYSAADVFLNTTYEDNYPTVNLEAISCSTPVLTYDTGGSPEFAKYLESNDYVNYVVAKDEVGKDIHVLKDYIDRLLENKKAFKVINRNLLSEKEMVKKYLELYK